MSLPLRQSCHEYIQVHPLTLFFPRAAWKLRFEGYGESTYNQGKQNPDNPQYPKLLPDRIPDDFPPYYQPSGPSHYGGTFVDVAGGLPTSDTGKVDVEKVESERLKLGKELEKMKFEDFNGCGKKHGDYPACWTDIKTKGCGAPAPVLHNASNDIVKGGY